MNIKEHFKRLYKLHGDSPKSVHWSDAKTQEKRFEILLGIDNNIKSLLDVGCGLGDMYQYMQTQGFGGRYCGTDFVDEFIEASKRKFNSPNVDFRINDIKNDTLPIGYDYVVLSGVFNNRADNNEDFMINTIRKMFSVCEKGIAFNAMSTYVDYYDEVLYYTNPLEIFDYCKRSLTRKVVLRHDYLVKENSIPYEYTIYLYR